MKGKIFIFFVIISLIIIPLYLLNADKSVASIATTEDITVETETGNKQLLYIAIKLENVEIVGVDGPFDLSEEQLKLIRGGKVTNRVLIGPFADEAARKAAIEQINTALSSRNI